MGSDLKHINLSPTVEASFGGEVRQRFEHYNNELFGLGTVTHEGYDLSRVLLFADLRIISGPRIFIEIGEHSAIGKRGTLQEADRDDLDLHQAFLDIPVSATIIRIGRQEMPLGSTRFVDYREGPNVRQTFDGIRVHSPLGTATLDLFGVAAPLSGETWTSSRSANRFPTLAAMHEGTESGTRSFDQPRDPTPTVGSESEADNCDVFPKTQPVPVESLRKAPEPTALPARPTSSVNWKPDPIRWVDAWNVEGLTPEYRNGIKAGLLCAHAEATEKATGSIDGMWMMTRSAFQILGDSFYDAGLLSNEVIDSLIPELVSDVTVAGRWRSGSETIARHLEFRFGHYWVAKSTPEMIRDIAHPQICRLQARLITSSAPGPERPKRSTGKNSLDARKASDQEPTPDSAGAPLNSVLGYAKIRDWMQTEGYDVPMLAERLNTSERALRSLLNNGDYHGKTLLAKLANLMGCDVLDLYEP